MRNGAASAATTSVPAATEPNSKLRNCIETAVSVDPVVPEVVRIDPALRLLRLALDRLGRPAAEQTATLVIRRLLGRRRRHPVALRAAVVAVIAVRILPIAG